MTVKVTGVRLFFQRFYLVFYLGQIGIRLFGKKIGVGSLSLLTYMILTYRVLRYEVPQSSVGTCMHPLAGADQAPQGV